MTPNEQLAAILSTCTEPPLDGDAVLRDSELDLLPVRALPAA